MFSLHSVVMVMSSLDGHWFVTWTMTAVERLPIKNCVDSNGDVVAVLHCKVDVCCNQTAGILRPILALVGALKTPTSQKP